MNEESLLIDRAICNLCLECTRICPTEALSPAAKYFDSKMLFKEILRDIDWYEGGGGITLTGGEPLVHEKFLEEFLPLAKTSGLHITAETSGCWNYKSLEPILGMINLFLFDIKIMDDEKHIQYIGKSNKTILDNIRALIKAGHNVQVRMPVIPGINNDDDNLSRTCDLLKSLELNSIVLLPYHTLGEGKLSKINSPLKSLNKDSLSKQDLEKVKDFFKFRGISPLGA